MDNKVKEPIKIFTSLDLELNQNKETGPKIIQIGATVGDLSTGEILEKLSVFVNPNQILEPFIIELTKIKQQHVDNGVTLLEAYNKLKEMHRRHKSFVNTITWGGGDSQDLFRQLKEENPNFQDWCFGRRWIDAKTLYVSWRLANQQPPKGGLSRAMANLGLQFKGCAHRADDDAENTFYAYKKLVELFKK
jgi:inhibitor of KinA sporulation pathway (predicted exonuclease)